jgi:hypothetical protein
MICQLAALQIVSMLAAVMETLDEFAESYKNHSRVSKETVQYL